MDKVYQGVIDHITDLIKEGKLKKGDKIPTERDLSVTLNVITKNETKYEMYHTNDAEIVLVAYGTTARICKTAIQDLRKEGIKAGLIRPITLWPYPDKAFEEVIDNTKAFLTVEMSLGQMVEDVKLAVNGRKPVHFYGRTGGVIPTPQEISQKVRELAGGDK